MLPANPVRDLRSLQPLEPSPGRRRAVSFRINSLTACQSSFKVAPTRKCPLLTCWDLRLSFYFHGRNDLEDLSLLSPWTSASSVQGYHSWLCHWFTYALVQAQASVTLHIQFHGSPWTGSEVLFCVASRLAEVGGARTPGWQL